MTSLHLTQFLIPARKLTKLAKGQS